jgi:hypothetical protein
MRLDHHDASLLDTARFADLPVDGIGEPPDLRCGKVRLRFSRLVCARIQKECA